MGIVFGTFIRVVAAVLLVGLLGSVGVGIYQAGFAAGAATTGTTVVAPFAGYGWYGPGWGLGGGILGFLGFLIVLFLFFGLLRALFWRGPRSSWGAGGWGHGGRGWSGSGDADRFRGSGWEQRAREIHDEWHRGHDAGSPAAPTSGSTGPGGTGSAS
jgi:hypothetical protein